MITYRNDSRCLTASPASKPKFHDHHQQRTIPLRQTTRGEPQAKSDVLLLGSNKFRYPGACLQLPQ